MKQYLFRLLLMFIAVGVIEPVDVNNLFKGITVASTKKESYNRLKSNIVRIPILDTTCWVLGQCCDRHILAGH